MSVSQSGGTDRVPPAIPLPKEYVVFPLLKLPDELLLEIAQKLDVKYRRHLLHTCSKWREILRHRRSKLLDCRVPVTMDCEFKQSPNDDLNLTIHVKKPESKSERNDRSQRRGMRGQSYVWTSIAGIFNIPAVFEKFFSEIGMIVCADQLSVYVRRMDLQEHITLAIASFLEVATKFYPTDLTTMIWSSTKFTTDVHIERMATLLLGGSRSLSFTADYKSCMTPPEDSDTVRLRRAPVTQHIVADARKRGIRIVCDGSGPESDFVFRLDVKEKEKCLIISGSTVEN